jgi:formate C-acetyltransferase
MCYVIPKKIPQSIISFINWGQLKMLAQWQGFQTGKWTEEINVRDFIQKNYTVYNGDESFLTGATSTTQALWDQVKDLMALEREKGILDTDTEVVSTITSHQPGYINSELEQVVGLQTDKPLKRAIMPLGGIRVVKDSLKAYGYELNPKTEEIFTKYRKTHNDGVFDAYTREMRLCRHSGIITGLPDAYGRGRIIGDYRRVALYGVDGLIDDKKAQLKSLELDVIDEDTIRLREEISEQIKALFQLKTMAASYGCSGYILATSQLSKNKMVRRCLWDEFRRS